MGINVSIIDDHPIVLQGLQNMLAAIPGINLIGAYTTAALLLEGLQSSHTDVLLLDIQMPGKSGDELVPEIQQHCPDVKIIVLSNVDSALYVYNMLKLGVKGYILKSVNPKILVAAIEKVYSGEDAIDPALVETMEEFTRKMKRESYLKPRLTQRELEILQHIANGESSQEIADKLFISIRTVEFYRLNILLKMDAKNTVALIKKALHMGLVK